MTLLFITYSICTIAKPVNNNPREYYIIQVYHCNSQKQINHIDAFLKDISLPHLHKMGIVKVGVFEPVDNDTAADKRLMVWIPIKSINEIDQLDNVIDQLDPMGNNSILGLKNADSSLPYTRIETTIAKAFKNQAQFSTKSDLVKSSARIYEFRSYEGPSEDMFLKKVHMFNEGKEIELFNKLNFNAIFYAKVIAGNRMPNLVYMTSFNNMDDRNAHWTAFSADPTWKIISNLPQYLKTVSKADIILMTAKDYADF